MACQMSPPRPTFQGPPAPRPAHIYVSVSVDFPRSPAGRQVASHHPSISQMTGPRSGKGGAADSHPFTPFHGSPAMLGSPRSAPPVGTVPPDSWACAKPSASGASQQFWSWAPPSASWGLRLHWCSRSQPLSTAFTTTRWALHVILHRHPHHSPST